MLPEEKPEGVNLYLVFTFLLHVFSFQGQAEASNAEIEDLKQALVENNINLRAIQKAFESENEATKERLRILENELEESKDELVRTKDELARAKSHLTSLSSKISSVWVAASHCSTCTVCVSTVSAECRMNSHGIDAPV